VLKLGLKSSGHFTMPKKLNRKSDFRIDMVNHMNQMRKIKKNLIDERDTLDLDINEMTHIKYQHQAGENQ